MREHALVANDGIGGSLHLGVPEMKVVCHSLRVRSEEREATGNEGTHGLVGCPNGAFDDVACKDAEGLVGNVPAPRVSTRNGERSGGRTGRWR